MTRTLFASWLWAALAALAAAEAPQCPDSAECLPRVGFLILVHNAETLESGERLLEALYHRDHHFFVHFDTKLDPQLYEYDWRRLTHGRKNVHALSQFDLKWGQWSMLEPWFLATKQALAESWDIFINLSGDSFPVLTPEALRRRLQDLGEYNFVTNSASITGLTPTAHSQFDPKWHKAKAFPNPILPPFEAEPHFGTQWMVLQRSFVEFIHAELADPASFAYRLGDWFQHSTIEIDSGRGLINVRPHIPDELFFPTVLVNSRFNTTVPPPRLPGVHSTLFVRMDEHYPWTNLQQRYEPPAGSDARSWGPYFLGVYDLSAIKRSGALFVRKVSAKVDDNLFNLLPVDDHVLLPDISWPTRDSPPLKVTSRSPHVKTDQNGCVRVAESLHCPPRHPIDPALVERYDLPVRDGG